MKTRNGFVSNSSTSSFTCDICEGVSVGYDGEYDGGEQEHQCENGHSFHDTCMSDTLSAELKEKWEKEDEPDQWDIPEKFCAVCMLISIQTNTTLNYLLKEASRTKDDVNDEIKSRYATLKDMDESEKN